MKKPRRRGILRELILLACALILLLIVRSFFLDLRHVPSASMEPTLKQQEWVLIDKLYGGFKQPQLFDLVMFDLPKVNVPYAKRIVGLPGTRLEINKGDLFFDGKMFRKSTEQFHELAVPLFDSREQTLAEQWVYQADRVFSPAKGKLRFLGHTPGEPAAIHRKNPYLSEEPVHPGVGRGSEPAHDAALEISFDTPETGTFFAILGEEGDRFEFVLRMGAGEWEGSFSRTAAGKTEILAQKKFPALPMKTAHHLEIGNVDNRLFFLLDGKECVPSFEYERNTAHMVFDSREPSFPSSPVQFGVRDGDLEISWFRLLRDIDYTNLGKIGVEEPCVLGTEEYFVLGDNSCCSEDSRYFGPVQRKAISGRPIAVLYPISFIRKL